MSAPNPELPSDPAVILSRPLLSPRILVLFIVQTAFGLGWSAYLVLPKFVSSVLGADAATLGTLSATSGATAVAVIPIVTMLIDRVPRRALFRVGAGLLVACSLGFVTVDRLGALVFLFQGCVGASYVFAFNASATLVADEAPPEKMGQAIGLFGAANMSMNAVSTVFAERIAAAFGWHAVFGSCAAAGLLAIALSSFVKETENPPVSSRTQSLLPALRGPLVPVFAVSALAGATFIAMFTFHQPYALSLGAKNVAAFFVGFTAAAMTMRLAFGSFGDRLGRRRVASAALVVYAAAALAVGHMHVEWLWAYGSLFGVAHGVFYPTLNAYAIEHAPAAARGRVMALYNGAFNLGSALGALAWGALAHAAGYASVFAPAAFVALVSAAILGRPASGDRARSASPFDGGR